MITRPLALGLIALAVSVSAQTPPAQEPPPPRQIFRTEANLVRVDVHVLKDGKPITGLTAADFELLEDGAVQKIDQFEYVRVDAPQSATVVNPSSTAAALDLASDPRNRVFVLFLDAYHVLEENSIQTPIPLVRLVDSLIGPSDLIGLMTPQMTFRDLILGRNTDVLRNALLGNGRWGRKIRDCNDVHHLDEIEKKYTVCYPPPPPPPLCQISPLAMELIIRRRESFTLGVLRDLVRSIGARREARTHIVLVSEGWPLRRDSDGLASVAANPPKVRIQPGGRLGTKNPDSYNVDTDECDRHLRAAATLDNQRTYQDLIEDANRNNVSFYAVDPGGLRVDEPRSPIRRPGDLGMRHVETLQVLADNTDGNAIIRTNDIAGALQRVVDDISGYYLLGYYSSNTKSDGTFRSIRVRVTRPGVEVRARKGYRAWTAADVKAMTAARAAAVAAESAAADPATAGRTAALGRLSRIAPSTAFFLHASVDAARSELHVAGELSTAAAKASEWRQGAEAQIMVTGPDGSPAGTGRATIAAGGRSFLARLPVSRAKAGEYEIAVRLRPAGGTTPLLETARAAIGTSAIGEAIAFRSADRQHPVASFFWWRTEVARVEAPVLPAASAPAARILDRAGNPMPVPITASIRDDGAGRWLVADLRLAPLAPGDYTIELTVDAGGTPARRFVPLRVER